MHERHTAEGPRAAQRPAVHIIDDDASVRTSLERLLISAGVRATTYPGAREFLESGRGRDGDCIVSDVRMHGMTGLDLQREIRKTGMHIAFVFVTAYDTPQARKEAIEAGATAFFRKPVDDQALLDAITWALSGSKTEAE